MSPYAPTAAAKLLGALVSGRLETRSAFEFARLSFARYCEAVVLGQRVLLGAASPRELRELRSLWFSDLARATEDYLRSPVFLEYMGLSLIAMSKAMHPFRSR